MDDTRMTMEATAKMKPMGNGTADMRFGVYSVSVASARSLPNLLLACAEITPDPRIKSRMPMMKNRICTAVMFV